MANTHNGAGPDLVGFRDLYARLGAGRSESAFRMATWRAIRAGKFPAPLTLSARGRVWRSDEIEAWVKGLGRVTYAPTAEPAQPAA